MTEPTSRPPWSPPPDWSPQAGGMQPIGAAAPASALPAANSSGSGITRKRVALAISGVLLGIVALAGAFFAGRVSVDPEGSAEYKSQAKELGGVEEQLHDKDSELDSVRDERDDALAQVDALVADLPPAETGADAPALSSGVALASRNIKLELKVREKQCFGSAGCLVTVQVDPSYVGNQDVTSGSWEVTYEIRGGEDGPIIDTMTLANGTWTFPEEQNLNISSSNSRLTAVATAVYTLD